MKLYYTALILLFMVNPLLFMIYFFYYGNSQKKFTEKIFLFIIGLLLIPHSCSSSQPVPVPVKVSGNTSEVKTKEKPNMVNPNSSPTATNFSYSKAPEPEDLFYQSLCINNGEPDLDKDGIDDKCEENLAEIYAPIIYHSSDDTNFPANVDWFLSKTSLWFYDDSCSPDLRKEIIDKPSQEQLFTQSFSEGCSVKEEAFSGGTRSLGKHRTFFLEDVENEFRKGSLNSSEWTTYFHSYQNDSGGITIQYWRFYSYNDAFNNHGGDWEAIMVILNKDFEPVKAGLLGHTGIEFEAWNKLELEGDKKTHPRIYSEGGGHASQKSSEGIKARGCNTLICNIDPQNQATFVRQETWKNGRVYWFNGNEGKSGGLLNLGEKTNPLNNQVFIKYSGLWGSPGIFYLTSGYWGPAYNETDMGSDGYITAWAAGMKNPQREEVYPASVSP